MHILKNMDFSFLFFFFFLHLSNTSDDLNFMMCITANMDDLIKTKETDSFKFNNEVI